MATSTTIASPAVFLLWIARQWITFFSCGSLVNNMYCSSSEVSMLWYPHLIDWTMAILRVVILITVSGMWFIIIVLVVWEFSPVFKVLLFICVILR